MYLIVITKITISIIKITLKIIIPIYLFSSNRALTLSFCAENLCFYRKDELKS